MKENRTLTNGLVVCGLALALVSTVAAQTPADGKATVIRVHGAARYIVGTSGWKPLKVGQVLKPGTVVQTDMNVGSYVDLVLADKAAAMPTADTTAGPTEPAGYTVPTSTGPWKVAAAQNVVRVWENTVLGIDKLTYQNTGADVVSETQLNLKAGHILGVVKKMSAASKYEITIPEGVAGIRGTVYELWANGKASATEGSMVLVRTKKTAGDAGAAVSGDAQTSTVVLTDGQSFDPGTGQTTQMTPVERRTLAEILAKINPPPGPPPGWTRAEDMTVKNISNR